MSTLFFSTTLAVEKRGHSVLSPAPLSNHTPIKKITVILISTLSFSTALAVEKHARRSLRPSSLPLHEITNEEQRMEKMVDIQNPTTVQ